MLRITKNIGISTILLCSIVLFQCSNKITTTYQPESSAIGVYVDDGAAEVCIIAARNMFLWMGFEVIDKDADDINSGKFDDIALIWFPGGNAGPYFRDISATGVENLRSFVSTGGAYMGVCAGAYFAAENCIWYGSTTGVNEGALGLYPGDAVGPINDIFPYPDYGMCQVNYPAVEHQITKDMGDSEWIIYYGGPEFVLHNGAQAETILTYEINGIPAAVANSYGKGRVFLISPHPEWEEDDPRDGVDYFKEFDDKGSDWDLVKAATLWCLHRI